MLVAYHQQTFGEPHHSLVLLLLAGQGIIPQHLDYAKDQQNDHALSAPIPNMEYHQIIDRAKYLVLSFQAPHQDDAK